MTRYVNVDASPVEYPRYHYPTNEYRDARDVTVLDSHGVDTGLLNHEGKRIFRLPNEIGFNR